jgi:hypothetical protein
MIGSKLGIVGAVGAIVFVLGLGGNARALDSADPSSGETVSFSSDGSEDGNSGTLYLMEGWHSLGVAFTNADGSAGDPTTLSFASDDASVQTDAAVGDGGSLSIQVNPGAFANLYWSAADGSSGSVQIVGIANDQPAPNDNQEISIP